MLFSYISEPSSVLYIFRYIDHGKSQIPLYYQGLNTVLRASPPDSAGGSLPSSVALTNTCAFSGSTNTLPVKSEMVVLTSFMSPLF